MCTLQTGKLCYNAINVNYVLVMSFLFVWFVTPFTRISLLPLGWFANLWWYIYEVVLRSTVPVMWKDFL